MIRDVGGAPQPPREPLQSAPAADTGPKESVSAPLLSSEEIQHRAMLARINAELRYHPPAPPEPAKEPPANELVERGHSDAGMIQDAQTGPHMGAVDGPLSATELWNFAPRPSIWR